MQKNPFIRCTGWKMGSRCGVGDVGAAEWNGVVAAFDKWVAAGQAAEREPGAADDAVLAIGGKAVVGAGRFVAALAAEEWPEDDLIEADQHLEGQRPWAAAGDHLLGPPPPLFVELGDQFAHELLIIREGRGGMSAGGEDEVVAAVSAEGQFVLHQPEGLA